MEMETAPSNCRNHDRNMTASCTDRTFTESPRHSVGAFFYRLSVQNTQSRFKEAIMPGEVKELIKDYQEGKITRRQFFRRAVVLTGSLEVLNRANPSPERL